MRLGLRNFLIEFVINNDSKIQHFERQELLHTIAVLFKRGWLEHETDEANAAMHAEVFQNIDGLLNSETTAHLGLGLLNALRTEFEGNSCFTPRTYCQYGFGLAISL